MVWPFKKVIIGFLGFERLVSSHPYFMPQYPQHFRKDVSELKEKLSEQAEETEKLIEEERLKVCIQPLLTL